MTYSIEVTREAFRALVKLDKPVRRRLQAAIDDLQREPRPHGVVALKGHHGAFRIRVGAYRIVYTIDDGRLVVVVVDLGHRSEIYRDLH
ncbi:type II toxin-antitoxin system RelE/ParE family toxin [Amycolatopsis sp. NPDC058986]|uniref:type II toxin-antitoxin system RelE family toxin n=1 Tax=unclassified Amycolatopsis TaxID=2618356 RepID=UPI00366BA1A4